jgi:hypothetical protein
MKQRLLLARLSEFSDAFNLSASDNMVASLLLTPFSVLSENEMKQLSVTAEIK